MISLETEDITEISSMGKCEGREKLRCVLGWEEFNEEIHIRQSTVLDMLYDSLMFCTNRHFLSVEVKQAVQLAESLLSYAKQGKELEEAVRCYRRSSAALLCQFNNDRLLCFTDFLFSTFFKHYKLYQLVLSMPRMPIHTCIALQVETPPPVLPPANQIQAVDVYNYERRMEEVEWKEEEIQREWEREKEQVKKMRCEDAMRLNERVWNLKVPLQKQDLLEVIDDTKTAQLSATSRSISAQINKNSGELECKLERRALPRPKQLGPPPNVS